MSLKASFNLKSKSGMPYGIASLGATVDLMSKEELKKNFVKVSGTIAVANKVNRNGFMFTKRALNNAVENFEKTKHLPHMNQAFVNHRYDDVNAKVGKVVSLWVEGDKLKYTALVDKRHPVGQRIDMFPSVSGTFILGKPLCASCSAPYGTCMHNTDPAVDSAALVEMSFVTFPSFEEDSVVERIESLSADAAKVVENLADDLLSDASPPKSEEAAVGVENVEKSESVENEGEAKDEGGDDAKVVLNEAGVSEVSATDAPYKKNLATGDATDEAQPLVERQEPVVEEREGSDEEVDPEVVEKLIEIADRIIALEEQL